jgi:hypothetical protein
MKCQLGEDVGAIRRLLWVSEATGILRMFYETGTSRRAGQALERAVFSECGTAAGLPLPTCPPVPADA